MANARFFYRSIPRWRAAIGAVFCVLAMGAARSPKPQPPAVPVIRTNGVPYPVGRFAKPTYGPDYGYGWVGGGAPGRKGEPRRVNEGVWGRDYSGVVFHRRVWPNWWHSPRAQGGTGAYRPDGPKLLHR